MGLPDGISGPDPKFKKIIGISNQPIRTNGDENLAHEHELNFIFTDYVRQLSAKWIKTFWVPTEEIIIIMIMLGFQFFQIWAAHSFGILIFSYNKVLQYVNSFVLKVKNIIPFS
jgi:hypothetical protein